MSEQKKSEQVKFEHPILKRLQQNYHDVLALHNRLFADTVEFTPMVKTPQLTLEQRVDFAFMLRETARLCESLQKELTKLDKLMSTIAAAMWTEKNINSLNTDPIRGQLATGSPNMRQCPILPKLKDDPENYMKLMKHLGVPETTASLDFVRPHWPTLTDLMTELAKEGKPIPPGIDQSKTFVEFTMRFQQHKDKTI